MKEIINTIIVSDYIGSKYQGSFNEFCSREVDVLLINGFTGIGKTYSMIAYAKANPNKKIVLACPTQLLVDNIKNDEAYKEIARFCGYGGRFAEEMHNQNFVVTTYDTALKIHGIDEIFIDEAHEMAGSADYRDAVVEIMQKKCKKILITATPEVIIDLPYFDNTFESVICFKKFVEDENVIIIKSRKKAETLIDDIINITKNSSKTILVRVKNKKIIDDAFNNCRRMFKGRKIGKIYSDDKNVLELEQSAEDVAKLKVGDIRGFDIVFCSNIYDAGLSLKVDRDVECYAVSHSNKIMPNPVNMRQLFARVRANTGFKMSLTILGNFGTYEADNSSLVINDYRLTSQEMAIRFNNLSNLTEQRYTALLGYHRMNCIIKEDLGAERRYSAGSASISDLIANLKITAPEYYNNIKLLLESLGQQKQLHWLEGTKNISNKGNNTKILREVNRIIKAIEAGISLDTFFTKTLVGYDTLNDHKEEYVIKYKPAVCDVLSLVYTKVDYGTDRTFINLVRGLAYNNGSNFNYKELELGMLNKVDNKAIRSTFDMMYKQGNFRGKSAKKVFKEGINEESEIVMLINSLVA